MSKKQTSILVAGIIFLMLLIDQLIKFYIKLHFRLGESFEVFSWFNLCFVENDGMAFGIEWGKKIFLTIFRIIAVGFLFYYIHILVRDKARVGYIVMVALVTAGAIGNIIDCLFYGLIFTESTPYAIATLSSGAGGYSTFLCGKVVDMFYFPLIHNAAGDVLFFRPVFNFADSCITVAVIAILLFFNKDLNKSLNKNEAK